MHLYLCSSQWLSSGKHIEWFDVDLQAIAPTLQILCVKDASVWEGRLWWQGWKNKTEQSRQSISEWRITRGEGTWGKGKQAMGHDIKNSVWDRRNAIESQGIVIICNISLKHWFIALFKKVSLCICIPQLFVSPTNTWTKMKCQQMYQALLLYIVHAQSANPACLLPSLKDGAFSRSCRSWCLKFSFLVLQILCCLGV